MQEPGIKICGLTRREDVTHAVQAGADLVGVVLVPESPRFRTPAQARELLRDISVPGVIVAANMGLPELSAAAERVGADVIQLHGAESPEMVERLRNAGPWKLWKAIRVRTSADVREGVTNYSGVAHGLVLDGWHPGKLGGTGAPFSWEEVSRMRDEFPPDLELVVAGGLRPENVQEVIIRLRPQVVDVSSGVEVEPGIKGRDRVEAFIGKVRSGGRSEGG